MPGLRLPDRADPLHDLLIMLQIPPEREKRQDIPPVLEIEPVTRGSRVRKKDRDLSPVPGPDRLRIFVQLPPLGKGLSQPRQIGLPVISDQHRGAPGFFHNALQGLNFCIVQGFPCRGARTVFRLKIDRPRRNLQALDAPGGGVYRVNHLP